MGKLRAKNRNEPEYLKGLIREKDAIIKSLRRRLRDLEKRQRVVDETDHLDDEIIIQEPKGRMCPNCGKGEIEILDLKYVVFEICHLCDHKEKI